MNVAGRSLACYVSVTRTVENVLHLVIGLGTVVAATLAPLLIREPWGFRELGRPS